MKNLIKGNEEGAFAFTNMKIDKLKEDGVNCPQEVLLSHIEVYRVIIDNLLEKWETDVELSDDMSSLT